jgi:NADP-dependent 3-hydroxy acid dehydrogenase YdfG
MGRVDGKVALVTGAASGLGEASSILLIAEGAKVVLCDIDIEKGEALAAVRSLICRLS